MADFDVRGNPVQQSRMMDAVVDFVKDEIATETEDIARSGFDFTGLAGDVSPVYTGHFIKNWTYTRGKPFTGVRGVRGGKLGSLFGADQGINREGDMVSGKPQFDDIYYIRNNVPYAGNVEDGTPGRDIKTKDIIKPKKPYLVAARTVEYMADR